VGCGGYALILSRDSTHQVFEENFITTVFVSQIELTPIPRKASTEDGFST
jgi:hypothetical protein